MSLIEDGMMNWISNSWVIKLESHGNFKQTCLEMEPVVVRSITIFGLTQSKNITDIAFFGQKQILCKFCPLFFFF